MIRMRFIQLTSAALSHGFFLLLFILYTPTLLSARAGAEYRKEPLTVGAVQFAVSEEVYQSMDTFRAAVEGSLYRLEAQAASIFAGRKLNLAVFPEYTSAFPGLSFLSPEEIDIITTDPADNRFLIGWALRMAEPELITMWSELSRKHGYAILAGTTLILDTDGNIHNRALLFSPDGTLIWTQDKVFPGAPEVSLLKLKTGNISDAQPFDIGGFRIVTTICRDTYHEEWETALPEADLWIDIKANELPYTREYYRKALGERLPDSPTDKGLTVSLSGEILGFNFSGPTEYLNDEGVIRSTDPSERNALIILAIE